MWEMLVGFVSGLGVPFVVALIAIAVENHLEEARLEKMDEENPFNDHFEY